MASSYLFLCCFLAFQSLVSGQLSTITPVPPIQWINLSPLLQGPSPPPPLRDASIGYDEDSRTLVIFGGESEGGFVQSRTFLLHLDTLTWSTPSPPANLGVTPTARSSAVSGLDFAASNRHAFVVIGGKGANDVPLSDVWAFDFNNQFWSQVLVSGTSPSPRWGASGGIDTRIDPIQDPILPGPNNTFYLAGGTNGKTILPLSDVWRLNISGTLSSNLPNMAQGSWQKIDLNASLPRRARHGGTVIDQRIVSTGGCDTILEDGDDDPSCAKQDSYVIDAQSRASIPPAACPPPRLDPVMFPNMNAFSSGFASQVFLTLGTRNATLWDDEGGLEQGEVDVLDVNTGTWNRLLPAGDISSSGNITFPVPREGAAVFSSVRGLAGSVRDGVSDTVIFGGRDSSGRYLSEVWLLRTYPGSLSSSSATWPGFGDGTLQSGINANGSGVTIEYFTRCASRRNLTDANPDVDDVDKDPPSPQKYGLDTSISHKLLSTLSLILLFLSSLLLRLYPRSLSTSSLHQLRSILISILTIGSYSVGVAGITLAFTSLHTVQKGETELDIPPSHLSTAHGVASLVLFSLLYAATPIFFFILFASRRYTRKAPPGAQTPDSRLRDLSPSPHEKPDHAHRSSSYLTSPIGLLYSPPTSPLPQSASPGFSPSHYPLRRSLEALSSDGESITQGSPRRGFEVLNRPARTRKQSETWSTSMGHGSTQPIPSARSLGDIDWLLRRRSLNAVGELDYALSIAHNARESSMATSDALQLTSVTQDGNNANQYPGTLDLGLYFLAQIGFLGLNITALIALWKHAPRAIGAVFLVWVIFIYGIVFFIPRRFETENFILSNLKKRSSQNAVKHPSSPAGGPTPTEMAPLSVAQGPYLHHPPFLRTVPVDMTCSSDDPRNVGGDDADEEDVDDETRQRMIEEEMDRREVSIVTVPKRKLWVANPS